MSRLVSTFACNLYSRYAVGIFEAHGRTLSQAPTLAHSHITHIILPSFPYWFSRGNNGPGILSLFPICFLILYLLLPLQLTNTSTVLTFIIYFCKNLCYHFTRIEICILVLVHKIIFNFKIFLIVSYCSLQPKNLATAPNYSSKYSMLDKYGINTKLFQMTPSGLRKTVISELVKLMVDKARKRTSDT